MAANPQELAITQYIKSLPEHLQRYWADILQSSEKVFQRPYTKYEGQRLAQAPAELEAARRMANEAGTQESLLQQSQQMLGKGKNFPEAAEQYMNPYVKHVVANIDEQANGAANQMLNDLDSRFAALGQHGSTRHRELANKMVRDLRNDVMAQKQRALAAGYTEGARAFSADEARNLEAAKLMGLMGGEKQRTRLADIDALSKMGDYQRQVEQQKLDTEYQDFLRQQAYEQNKIAAHMATLQQTPYPDITTTTSAGAPQPILNPIGSMGNIAGSILASRMTGRAHGGDFNPAIHHYYLRHEG